MGMQVKNPPTGTGLLLLLLLEAYSERVELEGHKQVKAF
jgi:hypothetical protein